MLYFTMLIIFLCLIIGPIVASRFLKKLPKIPMDLMQPTGQNNNDTSSIITGARLNGAGGAGATGDALAATGTESAAAATDTGADFVGRFRY